MYKVSNKNTNFVNFEYISLIVLLFAMLTLNK